MYIVITNFSATISLCNQCNSRLILVSQKTSTPDGYKFSQTTSVYQCSNEACQKEIDQQTEKRIKIQRDKELKLQQKADARSEEKRILHTISQEEVGS